MNIYVPLSFLSTRWNRSRRHRSEAIASSTSHDRRGQPLAENGQFKSVEVFFWLVKLFDLKMSGMSFDICHLFFFRLWEVGIDSAMLEFLRNGSTKCLRHPLAQKQIPLVAMMCHAIELLSFSQQNFQHPCLLFSPGCNGFNLWLGWHVGSGQTILQRRFLENACDLAWLEALLYLKGTM